MQAVCRRRLSRVVVLDLLGLVMFSLLACFVLYQYLLSHRGVGSTTTFLSSSDLHGGQGKAGSVAVAVSLDRTINNDQCTMGSCFDVSRCTQNGKFKVFVYPDQKGFKSSVLYQKILSVIRRSRYFTSDPSEACVFVPSLDTLDRDELSKDYHKHLPPLSSLEHWNGGKNHIVFNQYAGTWPDYTETLGFDTGKAILAKASFSVDMFRQGFDVSLPLLHKNHPERVGEPGTLQSNGSLFPLKRKYLLAFKGKRYLYGTGTETRSSLHHLHNGRDVVMLTTCKHNTDWGKHQDQRCPIDNQLYDKYEYSDLLVNSSFCLVPRGRRLGSFRFLEVLQAACIPVSLSNGYVLPFNEVIDWSKASLDIDERRHLQMTSIIRGVSSPRLLALRLHTQFLWNKYFSTVENVVMTTLEIIRNRLNPKPAFVWNQFPGGLAYHQSFSPLPQAFPFYPTHSVDKREEYTVVITTSRPATRESAPLVSLIRALSTGAHLARIVVLWTGRGPPRVSEFSTAVPVRVVSCEGERLVDRFWPLDFVQTDAVLHLTENVVTSSDEVEFGFSVWQAFRDRLVGYIGHTHYWDSVRKNWGYSSEPSNEFSILLSRMLFTHKYYGYLLHQTLTPKLLELANENIYCLDIVLNFLAADITGKLPVKVTQRSDSTKTHLSVSTATLQRINQERVACLNMVADAYGRIPLQHSLVRADPVLFRDKVSMTRKEFRQLE